MIKDVLFDGEKVGTIEVNKKGLYYHFICKCRFAEQGKYRIVVSCGNKSVSLGLCVPKGKEFGFETSVPIKRFADGNMVFHAVTDEEIRFYAITQESAFDHITELRKAKYAVREGKAGVVITDRLSDR